MAKYIGGLNLFLPRLPFPTLPIRLVVRFVQLQPGVELVSHQNWSIAETAQSSTWRELKAVCLALEAFASHLSGAKVVWYSDNQNVDLQLLALQAFHICLQFGISLDPKWIPRDLNSSTDLISKLIDFDDFELNDVIFQGLDELWGPHTVVQRLHLQCQATKI